ncbi:MAG: M20/M25/M40 family metallo-hydrolase [Peptococcaceae bacterium]|nr:M20/M25/M40 family metallo-hydrolase [Peptococcaceae bacterium]
MVDRNRLIESFMEMVQIDSLSRREGRFAEYLRSVLNDLGMEVTEDGTAAIINGQTGNIVAHLPGELDAPVLLFCAHMDTVEPGLRVKPKVRDGVISSAGDTVLGGDDKAGIAAIVEAVRAARTEGLRLPAVKLVFTVAEEVGLLGSKNLDYHLVGRADMGFVLDGDGAPGKIIVRAPSQDRLVATVHGRAAHAGVNPEQGINAIQVAAKAVAGLPLGRIDEETTANIGVIRGGQAINIVPDKVVLEGETRSLDDRKRAALTARLTRLMEESVHGTGAEITIEVEHLYSSFRLDESHPVVRAAVKAAEAAGLQPVLEQSGGGSDANMLNAAGIPTVNLAIGMEKVHTTEEYLRIKDLMDSCRLVYSILKLASEGDLG